MKIRLLMLLAVILICRISWSQTPDASAAITGISTSGVGYATYSRSDNGINAQIGRWDTPYTGGVNGQPLPGVEPNGTSTLELGIDVNNGGRLTFSYTFKTWDAGIYDWFDISLITPTGRVSLVNKLGKPGSEYGSLFSSAAIPLSISLDQWKNQHVTIVFSVVQDGWGDQTQGEVLGLNLSGCAVSPITPLTDAAALRFENGSSLDETNLQPAMQTALGCLRTAVASSGGALNVSSAYRPASYQAHLREVWDKWRLLKDNRETGCAELKVAVGNEFRRHGLLLTQRPAGTSNHSAGGAVDMRSTLPLATLLNLASGCQLYRPHAVPDPVHFEHN